jgi:putative solute:sodium symporter small subunit
MSANDSPPVAQAGSTVRDIDGIDVHDPRVAACIDRYWRQNVTVMLILLAIWAIAGLGCGVLFADVLNQFKIGGFPLGFWFAQQGSIIVFVLLILIYCIVLNRLDAHHHDELLRLRDEHRAGHANGSQGG